MQEIKKMFFDGTNDDFKRIVDSYKLLLYSVVYAASAYADADDIVQETFIYAYYHWGMLRDKNKLSSWLCSIAKNKAAHAMRRAHMTVPMEDLDNKANMQYLADKNFEVWKEIYESEYGIPLDYSTPNN